MIKIELTHEELQALVGLIDAGVRQVGLRALVPEAISILQKLEQAQKENDDGDL
jgi:hypothetical protein